MLLLHLEGSIQAARKGQQQRQDVLADRDGMHPGGVDQCPVTLSGFGRIFYRHRRVNIKRKSGNIADFLRRWSRNYDYMIVLDADSLMSAPLPLSILRFRIIPCPLNIFRRVRYCPLRRT